MFIGSWRKYQRPLIVFIMSGVIFTFIFWGMGDPGAMVQSITGTAQGPGVLGSVGGEPITGDEFNRALERIRQQQTQFGGEVPSNQELWEQGAVWAAWDDLVNDKLFEVFAQRDGFTYQRDFLVDQMKKMPDFQLPDGSFDGRAWNEWVTNPRVDWNVWYEQSERSTNRRLYAERVLASARVFEDELRKRFALENTELTLRYTSIEPPVTVSEEEVAAQYEEDPSQYAHLQEWRASFVRVPLEPDVAQDLAAVESLAASGESFENLAELFAEEPLFASQSELGWLELDDNLPELRQPLRELAVDETSAPIRSGTGYLVYKVLEERFEEVVAAEGGEAEAAAPVRSVRVQQLVLRPQLAPEERQAITAEAESILASARSEENLQELAEHFGYEFGTTSLFDAGTENIDGIAQADLFSFRNAFRGELAEGDVPDLIRGSLGLYIARVEEKPERRPRTLDEVFDEVRADLVQARKASPQFRDEVRTLGLDIRDTVNDIDDIAAAFPNVTVHIDQTDPFTTTTFSYATGIRWNVHEVAGAAAELEPGQMGGPFSDFLGQSVYFVELVAKTEPTEEVWEERWPTRREQLLDGAYRMAQNQQFEDYMLFLRERAVNELNVTRNDALIFRFLGLDQQSVPVPAAEPAAEATK